MASAVSFISANLLQLSLWQHLSWDLLNLLIQKPLLAGGRLPVSCMGSERETCPSLTLGTPGWTLDKTGGAHTALATPGRREHVTHGAALARKI